MVSAAEDPDAPRQTTSYQRSKDAGLFKDHIPNLRPAGKTTTMFEDTAGRDLAPEIFFPRPDTPPQQRKFRKNIIPGEICTHHGLLDQHLPHEEFRYGVRSDKGETVQRTFEDGQKLGIEAYKNACAESVYISNKREPLGEGYNRGHTHPDICKDPKWPGYGVKSKDVEDGKLIIFPRGVQPDSDDTKAKYRFSHGNYGPGEQVNREYTWPGESQGDNFRFGKADDKLGSGEAGGVKSALDWERDQKGKMHSTRVGRTTLVDFRNVNNEQLGKVKNYCQGKPKVPEGHAFGIVSAGANDTAGACVKGTYPLDEQLPDRDLGRCLIPGRRNIGNEKRAFGVPSVRVDIPAPDPKKRSVADMQNFGDEIGAAAVLNPQRFENLGIPDKEFLLRRDKEEISSVLKGAGYCDVEKGLLNGNFEEVWKAAVSLFDDELDMASLDSILYVYGSVLEDETESRLDKVRG